MNFIGWAYQRACCSSFNVIKKELVAFLGFSMVWGGFVLGYEQAIQIFGDEMSKSLLATV
jgi:hypothetical protein